MTVTIFTHAAKGALLTPAEADASLINIKSAVEALQDSALSAAEPVDVSYSTSIPLDTRGPGKLMPRTVLVANSMFAVGPSPVDDGNCTLVLVGDGSHIPDFSAFENLDNYDFDETTDVRNLLTFVYIDGAACFFGRAMSSVAASVPGQVTGLSAGLATSTTQPLTWTPPAGSVTNYLVEYKAASSGTWLTFSHGTSSVTAITVTGLSSLTSYNYRVSATNTAGTGTPSSTLTASTGAVVAVPGQVTGLTAGTATQTTQPLSWSVPSGTPTDYVTEFKASSSGTWLTFADGTSSTPSTTVNSLTPNTSYDYRVSATNSGGPGTVSSTVTASTAAVVAPGQVTGLTAGTATSTTQPLTWSAPSGTPTDYLVEYKAASSGTWLTFTDGVSTATSATVTGLTASTSYNYRVSAINVGGTGTVSSTVTNSTAATPTGTLSSTAPAIGTTLDLDPYTDYFWVRESTGANLQQTGQPVFTVLTKTNVTPIIATGTWPTLSGTGCINANDSSFVGAFSNSDANMYAQSVAGVWGVSTSIPAGTSPQVLRIHFGGLRDDSYSTLGRCKLTLTLSDGSAGPLVISTAAPSGDGIVVAERHDITFAAAASSQTLSLLFEGYAGNTVSDIIAIQLLALT